MVNVFLALAEFVADDSVQGSVPLRRLAKHRGRISVPVVWGRLFVFVKISFASHLVQNT